MYFVSPMLGFGVGAGLYRTTNGGVTWKKVQALKSASRDYLTSLVFAGQSPVMAFGEGGQVFGLDTWTGQQPYSVTGRVVKNETNDCIQDTNEAGRPYRIIVAEPGTFYSNSKPDGTYSIALDTGHYSIRQLPTSPILALLETQFCPPGNASIPVAINGAADTMSGNNFINNVRYCPVLAISQNHDFTRPCRRSSLEIVIQNTGNMVSDSEMVYVKLPSSLSFISANIGFQYNAGDSTYQFKLKPLEPYEKFSISIVDSLACTSAPVFNFVLCVKATIPHVPACLLQSPGWDGADLEVASRCQNGQTKFMLRNTGASMPASSQYQIFIDSALVYQAAFQLAANNQMTVALPAGTPGGFARLVVPQSANHPLSTFASAEANCSNGLSSNGQFPEPDESPLVDIACFRVRSSFDPNDKTVFPFGIGNNGKVEPETMLKYKIRFQNTGNDTAFKVVLIDTLDAGFDISTLQIGSSSHLFDFNVSGKGRPVLRWTFDNILLPDSNTNEEKSHGFVSYSIRPKAGLALGTKLENFADIYFDFNDPVRTNTTVNTLWQPTYTPGILDTVFVTKAKTSIAGKSLKISPNPAVDEISVLLPEGNTAQLDITDLQGRTIKSVVVFSGEWISIKDLKPGVYIFKIEGHRAERLIVKP